MSLEPLITDMSIAVEMGERLFHPQGPSHALGPEACPLPPPLPSDPSLSVNVEVAGGMLRPHSNHLETVRVGAFVIILELGVLILSPLVLLTIPVLVGVWAAGLWVSYVVAPIITLLTVLLTIAGMAIALCLLLPILIPLLLSFLGLHATDLVIDTLVGYSRRFMLAAEALSPVPFKRQ